MNIFFLLSGILTGLATIAHGLGGQIVNIQHLKQSGLPYNEQLEFYGTWHAISILFGLCSLVLLALGLELHITGGLQLGQFIGLTFLLFGVFFFFMILKQNKNYLVKTPQWLLLAVMGILALLGSLG